MATGYDQVLKYPDSPLYDLALFKTAWCFWKLGDSDAAAKRFKEVLDLGSGKLVKAHQITKEGKKRLEELKGEALEYLVQVFTEDERKGPKDAFEVSTMELRDQFVGAFSQSFKTNRQASAEDDDVDQMNEGRMRGRARSRKR